jgi:cell division protein FtsL
MALLLLVLIAAVVVFCGGVLVGTSVADALLSSRYRRQAEAQRLINEHWHALQVREDMLDVHEHGRRFSSDRAGADELSASSDSR